MISLIQEISKLRNQNISKTINKRLKEFTRFKNKSNEEWFSELCFCILTANSRADTAINIQKDLGSKGFLNYDFNKLSNTIKSNKHRFHNNKAKYIIEARKFSNLKEIIFSLKDKRLWLVKNIKGLGLKEASHFLRNVGFFNYSIIDRHIINLLRENNLIKIKTNQISKKEYLKVGSILRKIGKETSMSLGELDLYLWYLKTGRILK